MEDYTRLTDILMGYWEGLKKNKGLPSENDINPDELSGVWDDCFLAQVMSNGRYRYSYLGKNLIEAYGDDLEKDEIDYLVSTSGHKTIEKFDEVVKNREPISDKGEFTNSKHLLIKYRQLLLPFLDTGGKVGFILGGMRWKAF